MAFSNAAAFPSITVSPPWSYSQHGAFYDNWQCHAAFVLGFILPLHNKQVILFTINKEGRGQGFISSVNIHPRINLNHLPPQALGYTKALLGRYIIYIGVEQIIF